MQRPRKPRANKPLETVLAENLSALMAYHEENQVSAARRAKIPQQQVSRILKGLHSVQLETVAAIAAGYELTPFQLLVPDLDPRNPPVLPLSATERRLYKRFKQVADEYAQQSREGVADGPGADSPSSGRAKQSED